MEGLILPYCPFCRQFFKDVFHLLVHFQTRHIDKDSFGKLNVRFRCELCGKTLMTSYQLWEHVRDQHRESLPRQARLPFCVK